MGRLNDHQTSEVFDQGLVGCDSHAHRHLRVHRDHMCGGVSANHLDFDYRLFAVDTYVMWTLVTVILLLLIVMLPPPNDGMRGG